MRDPFKCYYFVRDPFVKDNALRLGVVFQVPALGPLEAIWFVVPQSPQNRLFHPCSKEIWEVPFVKDNASRIDAGFQGPALGPLEAIGFVVPQSPQNATQFTISLLFKGDMWSDTYIPKKIALVIQFADPPNFCCDPLLGRDPEFAERCSRRHNMITHLITVCCYLGVHYYDH